MLAKIQLSRSMVLLASLAAAAVLVAGCGGSSGDSSTTSAPATTAPTTASPASTTTPGSDAEATKVFDEQIQSELQKVGCYQGAVDGILGPASDQAIVEFQRAEGLATDGELGAETESALKRAVEAGRRVCTASTSTTKPAQTTTTAASGAPACTAALIRDGLEGDAGTRVISFVCSGRYAAVTFTDGDSPPAKTVLEANTDGGWAQRSQDPCGTASAGLPPIILENGC
ncbi:MAG: peptidoglycan-binding protein [Actinobacteria bacterium]|nr:peptidoglycan-binding protein [Actinomycetota bacterium]